VRCSCPGLSSPNSFWLLQPLPGCHHCITNAYYRQGRRIQVDRGCPKGPKPPARRSPFPGDSVTFNGIEPQEVFLDARFRHGLLALILLATAPVAVKSATAQSTSGQVATVTSPEGLNLRSTPATSGTVVIIIPFDAQVSITGSATSDSWYPVAYNGSSGWASGQYLAAGALSAPAARTAVALVAPSIRTAASTPSTGTPSGAPALLNAAAAAVPQITNPASSSGATYSETVSYYGIDDATVTGATMSCGQPFDPYFQHGAATNDFNCGTWLLITSPDGKQVEAQVMDHGGYTTHWIDLTYSTFGVIADRRSGSIQATVKVLTQP
jgi:uncharacterized protein YraI